MANVTQLNIDVIRSNLVKTQKKFKKINPTLSANRPKPTDEVIENLIAGYERVNVCLAKGTDLFEMGNSEVLLELNQIVLYYHSEISEEEKESQFEATKKHFYEAKDGGIGALMEWLRGHQHANIWKRAAGVFTFIISQPQLFLEGNHRTASLIISYMLVREGYPPFVLTQDNAKLFFEPAENIKQRRKKTLDDFFFLPWQRYVIATLLEREQNAKYLMEVEMALEEQTEASTENNH